MTIHSARNAVSAADPLQPALHADRPGYFVAGAGTPVVMLHSSLAGTILQCGIVTGEFRAVIVELIEGSIRIH